MKSIFAVLFMILSFTAFADCNREAQFIGTVTNVKYKPATESSRESFTFQLKLGRWFAPSMVCPLDDMEFEEAVIKMEGFPSIVDGDEVSGVLVFDQKILLLFSLLLYARFWSPLLHFLLLHWHYNILLYHWHLSQ